MKSFKPILSILVIGIFAFMAIASGDDDAARDEVTETEVDFKVTAQEIVSEYSDNEITAHQKYENKIVEVTGIISSFGLGAFDDPYMVISPNGIALEAGVHAYLADDVDASSFEVGNEITIKGKVGSKTLGDIMVKGCVVVK